MYVLIKINSKEIKATDNDYNKKLFHFFEKQAKSNVSLWQKNKSYSCQINGQNTTFKFNYDIVRRDRKKIKSTIKHDNVRYEVISNNDPIGQGGFGTVIDIKSTLSFKNKGSTIVLNEKQHGKDRKTRVVKIQNHDYFQNPVSFSTNEYEKSKKIASLAVKKPTVIKTDVQSIYSQSYMVMNKLPGADLYNILRQNKLSIRQRIELSQALLRALDKLTQQGIIHQDIKPENIRVDLTKTPIDVTIFDFGLSIDGTKKSDRKAAGTPGYFSPEMYKKAILINEDAKTFPKIDYKTDVYSLAHVIAQVWNSNRSFYGNENIWTISFEEIKNNLFYHITDFEGSQKEVIQETLKGMLEINPEKRLSISQAIKKFSAVNKSKSVFSSVQSFFVGAKTTLRDSALVSPKKITSFTDDKINDIKNMIDKLQKEIESIWPYPDKDKKELKKRGLEKILTMIEKSQNKDKKKLKKRGLENLSKMNNDEIKQMIKDMKDDPSITGGKFSTRTADLLDSLLLEEKTEIKYR